MMNTTSTVGAPSANGDSGRSNGERDDPRGLEHDIEAVRARMGVLIDELDQRRRDVTDPRRHPLAAVIVATAGLLTITAMLSKLVRALRPNRRAKRVEEILRALALVPQQ